MPPLPEALDGARSGSSRERLKVCKKSHAAGRKPHASPSSSSSSSASSLLQQRFPLITYAPALKVIYTSPSSFMELVQKLTGLPRADHCPPPHKPGGRNEVDTQIKGTSTSPFHNNEDRACRSHAQAPRSHAQVPQRGGDSSPLTSAFNNSFKTPNDAALTGSKSLGSCSSSLQQRSTMRPDFYRSICAESPSVLEDNNSLASDCNSIV